MFSLFAVAVALAAAQTPSDTLTVATRTPVPVVDGRADTREYGAPSVRIVTAAGDVQVWVTRDAEFLYIAASLPDTSFYWGDDFVISLDADGSADASPQTGDRQWYLRRVLDSSEVSSASGGRWNTPGQPTPMLGATRHHDEWDVASSSTSAGWTVELRIRARVLTSGAALPRIAFRTYNSGPRGWWSWPAPPAGTPAQRVERDPRLWSLLSFR